MLIRSEIHKLTIRTNGRLLSSGDREFIERMEVFNYPIQDSMAVLDHNLNLRALVFVVGSPIGGITQIIEAMIVDGHIFPGFWTSGTVDPLGHDSISHPSFAEAWDKMHVDFVNLYEGVKK